MDISASRSESGFRHPSEMPEVRVINLGGGNSAHSVNDRKVGKYVDFEEREQDGVPIKCRSIKKIAVNALIGVAVVGTVGSVIVASPVLAVYDVVRAGMEYIVPNCSLLGAVVTLIAIACVSLVVVPLAFVPMVTISALAGVLIAAAFIVAAEDAGLLEEMLYTATLIFSPVLAPLSVIADVPVAIVKYSIRASGYVMGKIMEKFPELYLN